MIHFPVLFAQALTHGQCVVVALPDALGSTPRLPSACGRSGQADSLPLEGGEHDLARALGAVQCIPFVGGRVALREAAAALHVRLGPILRTDRGAPQVPEGWTASISHKRSQAAALLARSACGHVGVDLELFQTRRIDISRRVLTPGEHAMIAPLDGDDRARAVLLRFSIKEAVYKAVDPLVRRYVRFDEIEVSPLQEGTAHVTGTLAATERLTIEATWCVDGDRILTTARAARGPR